MRTRLQQRPILFALALSIGLVTVVAVHGFFWLATGKTLNLADEWGNFLAHILIAAAPFGLLALAGIRNRAAWLVGLALTAAFWGYYLFVGIRYQLSGDRSGANIGLGLVMLLSPLIISAACLIASKDPKTRPS